MPWTLDDAPDQSGKRFVITGANSGLGLESARLVAMKGGAVVLACRSIEKGEQAVASIRAQAPRAVLEVMALDLSSLSSIEAFAAALAAKHRSVDVLMNNAGVMALPYRKTADGFELQLGTNHLGHFALTARLLPLLEAAPAARVVNTSSAVHHLGRIAFDDLQSERRYSRWGAYCQSKLANLLFTYELERWLRRHGKKTISVAAHPGYAATNLQAVGAKMEQASLSETFMNVGNALFAQSAAQGALPQVYAAVHPDVQGGQFFGPDGLLGLAGFPRAVSSNAASRDEAAAAKLWTVSEQLTKVSFAA